MLKCPKCNEKLIQVNRSYKCIHNHTFDLSKSGYLNVSLKNKKNSGDNELMIKARSSFLEMNYYDFMRQFVKNKLSKEDILVDAGCGQGYYTKEFSQNVKECYGLDLSKEAILYASKHDKNTLYFVASLFDMPFFSNSIDCVTSIFVPLGKEEIYRILKPNGKWIVVGPGPRHCWELKEHLYEVPYENKLPSCIQEGFEMIQRDIISNRIFVQDVWSLLEMTPYRYKTSKQALEKLQQSNGFEVTFEFVVTEWRKL
ncbi:methyltransferase domain-containing protein [Floccifex sp.]|uniref:methyltransferase domain-containing protein n=1 Tax=Floccifex sp. TaxID=2815810 RepID=UPI003F011D50